MYPVSEAYKTAIRARTRTDRVTGTLTLTDGTVLPLTAAELMSGSLTLDNQCVTGEELAFGCAYLRAAAAGRPVGGDPARQLYRGGGRAQGAVCQHQGV